MSTRCSDDQGLADEGEDTSGHDQDKGGLVAWRRLHAHHVRTLRCKGTKCNALSLGLPPSVGERFAGGVVACLDGVAIGEAVQEAVECRSRPGNPAQRGRGQGLREDIQGMQVVRENRCGENPA